MEDKLAEIMAAKRRDLAASRRPVRTAEWRTVRRDGRSFAEALRRPDGLAVIAEIKRKSPSAGNIADIPSAEEQARNYYNAGADAISVLTDERYFGGTMHDLWEVTDLLNPRVDARPVLRKDFFIEPIQVLEAAEAGAAAILIIVRALTDEEIRLLYSAAQEAGLDALFEVHSEPEIARALDAGARIIGVNNRDLARFRTDLAISEELIPRIPDDCVRISESGIFTPEDLARARACGADAVLIGEALMKSDDPAELIAAAHELA